MGRRVGLPSSSAAKPGARQEMAGDGNEACVAPADAGVLLQRRQAELDAMLERVTRATLAPDSF